MSKGERERERENLLDSGKKKGKILKIILKKKKIIAICAILHAECLMLTKNKKNAICAILHA